MGDRACANAPELPARSPSQGMTKPESVLAQQTDIAGELIDLLNRPVNGDSEVVQLLHGCLAEFRFEIFVLFRFLGDIAEIDEEQAIRAPG